jgi:hypothetical protein
MSFRTISITSVLLLSTAASAFAQSCAPKVADSELVKPGTLTMSTNPTLPPMQFVDSTGELKGMRVELGKEIAKRLCLAPEYVRIEFSAMIPGLQAGRWDMINTGIFFTKERAAIMQMIPYEDQAISVSVATSNTTVKDKDGLEPVLSTPNSRPPARRGSSFRLSIILRSPFRRCAPVKSKASFQSMVSQRNMILVAISAVPSAVSIQHLLPLLSRVRNLQTRYPASSKT